MNIPSKKNPRARRTVCIPEALDARIARLAQLEYRSMSAQVVFMLERAIDHHEARATRAADDE